jgi:hypothetical protein
MHPTYTVFVLALMLLTGGLVLWIEHRRRDRPCAICDQPAGHRCRGMWVCAHHRRIIQQIHRQRRATQA